MKVKINFFQYKFIQAIGAGIYMISVCKNNKSKALYIGESVFVLVRCASHLYELNKNPNFFGFTKDTIEDESIELKFSLIESENNKIERKNKEKESIKKHKPLTQTGISDRQKSIEEKILALTDFLEQAVNQYSKL